MCSRHLREEGHAEFPEAEVQAGVMATWKALRSGDREVVSSGWRDGRHADDCCLVHSLHSQAIG